MARHLDLSATPPGEQHEVEHRLTRLAAGAPGAEPFRIGGETVWLRWAGPWQAHFPGGTVAVHPFVRGR